LADRKKPVHAVVAATRNVRVNLNRSPFRVTFLERPR
jgi:hypothetical protein